MRKNVVCNQQRLSRKLREQKFQNFRKFPAIGVNVEAGGDYSAFAGASDQASQMVL